MFTKCEGIIGGLSDKIETALWPMVTMTDL